MIAFAFGVFGLIIGSFLNVLILRHGARSLGGRSECMSCGATIHWFDNIPVLSWALLKGRCRKCGSAISLQYPLVEIVTGALFAFLGGSIFVLGDPISIVQAILSCLIAALLVAIAAYDFRHTIIPDRWAYSFALSALAVSMLPLLAMPGALIPILAGGPITALPLFALWLVSRGTWMGFGDVKLSLGIGWLLGPVYGLFAIFFAFILGACVSVPLLALSSPWGKRYLSGFIPHRFFARSGAGFTMGSEIPFGPFLVASCIIIWFLSTIGVNPLALIGLGTIAVFFP